MTPDRPRPTFSFDGAEVPFDDGQTVLEAVLTDGGYVPHLCFHPSFPPHGSCRVCVVKVDGRTVPSCTTPARAGATVESETPELRELRTGLVQLLFVEGDHFCPSCEVSGRCTLQAVAYDLGVTTPHFPPRYPARPIDASHPEILLEFDRCILCELCVRASERDGKNVFGLSGRGIEKHLVVNAESGRLADTAIATTDSAVSVCPVGVILPKGRGFDEPIGHRRYDERPIREVAPERFAALRAGREPR